ncbi:MAG: hypothetical protein JWO53_630 [Chlamydiia bacterium]|nr:hypothetical protein [Chlamydiia bacterium]
MDILVRFFLLLFLLSVSDTEALYESLDPTSISEHLAYYELYKDTKTGKQALDDAWKLISPVKRAATLQFPENIGSFIYLIHPVEEFKKKEQFELSDEAEETLNTIATHLPNRQLKGYTSDAIESLSEDEIDLGHALFLLNLGNDRKKARSYEALLDLMALQVLAKIPKNATANEKINEINRLIFYEMGFRFPPHSIHEEAIDEFTFLPSILESRRGVCLGVSTLYLALAQRVGLQLDIYTPPGHIFISHNGRNIETTMRGVHIHFDEYLNINTKKLKKRSLKEVPGMVYMNQASIFLGTGRWQEAAATYEKALRFMKDDRQIKELLGSTYFILGEQGKAIKLLQEAAKQPDSETISSDHLAEDIVQGRVSKDALQAVFMHVDETRKSIEKKKDMLVQAMKSSPQFRSGYHLLAMLWVELKKPQEAIICLEKLHAIDPNDISCEYYLAVLYHERFNDKKAIQHFERAEKIAADHGSMPKPLQELKIALLTAR